MKTKPEKTCPFCGRVPYIRVEDLYPNKDKLKFVAFVFCYNDEPTSHACTKGYGDTPEEAINQAIEKWDTRV